MGVWTRADGRCVVRDPDDVSETVTDRDLYAFVEETDESRREAFARLGFELHRRELEVVLPTDPAVTGLSAATPLPGFSFLRADEADEDELRLLDDALRQDVPGTDGWRWEPADFHEETYAFAGFDPVLYLVAVAPDGAYAGIARVWSRPELPRLGLIGVVRAHRRRGLARALLAPVFATLHIRGHAEVATHVDETNAASRALLEGIGGRRVGALLELVRYATG